MQTETRTKHLSQHHWDTIDVPPPVPQPVSFVHACSGIQLVSQSIQLPVPAGPGGLFVRCYLAFGGPVSRNSSTKKGDRMGQPVSTVAGQLQTPQYPLGQGDLFKNYKYTHSLSVRRAHLRSRGIKPCGKTSDFRPEAESKSRWQTLRSPNWPGTLFPIPSGTITSSIIHRVTWARFKPERWICNSRTGRAAPPRSKSNRPIFGDH